MPTTQVLLPDRLSRSDLDARLAQGWYRVGARMMTCRLLVGEVLRSAIWTRLELPDYRFKRSHRKLLARLGRRFRITHGPLQLSADRKALYRRYAEHARGDRAPSLEVFLGMPGCATLYNTHEITVWDGDRLVAMSLYDVGAVAVQSLVGAYDPDYAQHSLGFASMLLEVQWAQRQGLRYHYSGYVLPGDPAWDYKLRLGPLEFLHYEDQRWLPISDLPNYAMPHSRLEQAMTRAQQALDQLDVPARTQLYDMFERPAYDRRVQNGLQHPMLVQCAPDANQATSLVIGYELDDACYQLHHARHVRAFLVYEDGSAVPDSDFWMWLELQSLGGFATAQEVAHTVARLLGRVQAG